VWTDAAGYVDPATRERLPSWDEALDQLDNDPEAEPAHVVRFGQQDDIKGLIAGAPETDRTIGCLCKYLTKSIAATYDEHDDCSPARAAHLERLAEEVRWLPCSPSCTDWLRYGVQPKGAKLGMVPGHEVFRTHPRPGRGRSLARPARPALEAHTGGIRRAPRAARVTRRNSAPAEARSSLGS
jgi:hypothetical protein